MSNSTWPINNSVVLSLEGLANRAGTYQNSATVELISLVDLRGQAVSGITYPLALSYVSASNGNYEVTISAAAGVTKNKVYRGTVRATSGGLQYESVERIVAKENVN
ncbi:MAG TPA: hypothetical protein VGA88_08345 [Burkholderiales bacterium]